MISDVHTQFKIFNVYFILQINSPLADRILIQLHKSLNLHLNFCYALIIPLPVWKLYSSKAIKSTFDLSLTIAPTTTQVWFWKLVYRCTRSTWKRYNLNLQGIHLGFLDLFTSVCRWSLYYKRDFPSTIFLLVALLRELYYCRRQRTRIFLQAYLLISGPGHGLYNYKCAWIHNKMIEPCYCHWKYLQRLFSKLE